METLEQTYHLTWSQVKRIFKINVSIETILDHNSDVLEVRITSMKLNNSWVGRYCKDLIMNRDRLMESVINKYLKHTDLNNILGKIKIDKYE